MPERDYRATMSVMDLTTGPLRDCCHRLLASTTEPLTAAAIADRVNATPNSVYRPLCELERRGAAVRERGGMSHYGRVPDLWRSSRS
jgi:predicted ArsR family transcriptional regulator